MRRAPAPCRHRVTSRALALPGIEGPEAPHVTRAPAPCRHRVTPRALALPGIEGPDAPRVAHPSCAGPWVARPRALACVAVVGAERRCFEHCHSYARARQVNSLNAAKCSKTLHLSMCLKNLSPKPSPLCAPSIMPGISAKVTSLSS